MFAYKLISSLGPSHDPSPYMAEIGSRSRIQTQNTIVCKNTGAENNRYLNGVKAVIYVKLKDSLLDK